MPESREIPRNPEKPAENHGNTPRRPAHGQVHRGRKGRRRPAHRTSMEIEHATGMARSATWAQLHQHGIDEKHPPASELWAKTPPRHAKSARTPLLALQNSASPLQPSPESMDTCAYIPVKYASRTDRAWKQRTKDLVVARISRISNGRLPVVECNVERSMRWSIDRLIERVILCSTKLTNCNAAPRSFFLSFFAKNLLTR